MHFMYGMDYDIKEPKHCNKENLLISNQVHDTHPCLNSHIIVQFPHVLLIQCTACFWELLKLFLRLG